MPIVLKYIAFVALKMRGVKLDLIDNPDMHKFLEMGIRGGVSMITHRHTKSDEHNKLMYWDANNLYGWAMSHKKK